MVLLTIAVVAGVAAVATGAVSGGLEEPATPIPPRALPDRALTGQDVAELRFVQAFRGYRMDQVDAAMDGLAGEIDRLRGLLSGQPVQPVQPVEPVEPRGAGEARRPAETAEVHLEKTSEPGQPG